MRACRALAVALALTTVAGTVLAACSSSSEPARELAATRDGRVDSRNGDCGWTAPFDEGRVLWVVCDPTALPNGRSNSVALATPDDRTPPFQQADFVPLAPDDVGRCAGEGGAASWINGVTTAPGREPGSILVTAFFIHGCRVRLLDRRDPGDMGVATFTWTPGTEMPWRAQVLRWDLFPGTWPSGERTATFGSGAVYHEGYHYAYACHPDEDPDWVGEQRCAVARAGRLSPLGARLVWSFWRGEDEGWVSCTPDRREPIGCSDDSYRAAIEAAAPMVMPLPEGEGPDRFTPLQFSVAWSEHLGRFVSAAPRAFADPTLRVRTAAAPEGPWSEPGDVPIDCDPGAVDGGFNCYHLAPHPDLGDATSMPFGFHDAGGDGPDDLELVSVPWCELATLAPRDGGGPCR